MHRGNQELNPSKKEAERIREKNAEAFDKAAGARNKDLQKRWKKASLSHIYQFLTWICISVLLKCSCHSSVSINLLLLRMF